MDRRSWTTQQDQAIMTLVQQFGVLDWTNISLKLKEIYQIEERTGKQCRERWYNHLNPEVNKKAWTNEQQTLLFHIHQKSGNKWKLMSKHFEGRTDNDIKNHFYSTLRRSLRRLNKFVGQKNSTTQMRQIKPSVLSTIMNCIYQQGDNIQSNIVDSLKDLPYLIFQFSNYKPVKSKGKVEVEEDQQIKKKINFIFTLINSANSTYQHLKQTNRVQKGKKNNCLVDHQQKQEIMDQRTQSIDFMRYLPKKGCASNSPQVAMLPRKAKKRSVKVINMLKHSDIKVQQYEKQEPEEDLSVQHQSDLELLRTDQMHQYLNDQYFTQKQEQSDNLNQSKQIDQDQMPSKIQYLRTRRISLQAYQQFMQDQSIGDIQQPSEVSVFYCPGSGSQGLIIVGKQIPIYTLQQGMQNMIEIQHYSSDQNIDHLITINQQN